MRQHSAQSAGRWNGASVSSRSQKRRSACISAAIQRNRPRRGGREPSSKSSSEATTRDLEPVLKATRPPRAGLRGPRTPAAGPRSHRRDRRSARGRGQSAGGSEPRSTRYLSAPARCGSGGAGVGACFEKGVLVLRAAFVRVLLVREGRAAWLGG